MKRLIPTYALALFGLLSWQALASAQNWGNNWDEVPLLVAPLVDTNTAAVRENQRRIAVPAMQVTPQQLQQSAPGIWSVRLYSANALHLSIGFHGLELAPDSEIVIRNPEGQQQAPVAVDQAIDGTLFLPMVNGDELWLQFVTHSEQRPQWRSAEVFHGVRSFRDAAQTAVPGQRAASCQVDVACAQGDAWREQIRAVARLIVGGQILCSGTLLNDTAQSLTPYLLTADHCGGDTGTRTQPDESINGPQPGQGPFFDAQDAATTVVYWNFQRSSCGGIDDGNINSQNQTGAQLRAADAFIDFALIELTQAPPVLADVFWAGWDARAAAVTSGAGIHHPQGEEKSINLFTRQAFKRSPTAPFAAEDYWRVEWSQGVTEAGSSGSALFDQNRRVVGSLSRGLSECNDLAAGDFYSAFDQAYDSNPASNRQLRAWLDMGNNGLRAVNGRDSTAAAPPVNNGGGSNGGGNNGGGNSGGGGGGGGGAIVWPLVLLLGLLSLARPRRRLI